MKKNSSSVMQKKLEHVTDSTGMKIDSGILETVVALNSLDLPTIQSCEGHLDHGIAAPWVIVGVEEGEILAKLKLEADALFYKGKLENNKELMQKGIERINLYNKKSKNENDKKYNIILTKLTNLLEEYDKENPTDWNNRLILEDLGQVCRIISQGAIKQKYRKLSDKVKYLKKYREEMNKFKRYLKKI